MSKRLLDPDSRLLQAAADPTRLAILRQLSGGTSICACDFTDCCDVAQPTVSHHLKVLREAGWVRAERSGTSISYSLLPEAIERFRAIGAGLSAGPALPAGMLSGEPAASAALRALPVIELKR